MARKRVIAETKSEPSPGSVEVRIQPDLKPDTPSYYVNFAAVAHTQYDFVVSVLRVPPQLTPQQTEVAKKGGVVLLEPTLQLILPPRLVDGLIKVLTTQKEKYEKDHGPIQRQPQEVDPGPDRT